MIKKLRRKFLLVAMASVSLVLILLLSVVNIWNFVSMQNDARKTVSAVVASAENVASVGEPQDLEVVLLGGRCISVVIDEQTKTFKILGIYHQNLDINSFTSYVNEAYGREQGRIKGFYFERGTYQGQMLYVFMDVSRELASCQNFLWGSVLFGVIGLALTFLVVWLLSRVAIRPTERAYEKQKAFITDAGHELKTPLTIISADTDILELEQGESEWTQSIKSQVKRLTEMTNHLVLLSRMEEEGGLAMSNFSLSEAVADSCDPYYALCEAKGKHLSTSINDGLSLYGNEASWRQVVGLLLDNAVKYGEGAIDLTLSVKGKTYVLTASNPVSTLKEGTHDELFERFVRGESSRNSETGGHGIGLSVVKAVAEAHKGTATAVVENGSIVFTITLPIVVKH